MNLGELIVELCADTAQLEKSLEQAKKKAYEAAASIEKSFDKINLEINVDDDSLTGLNKHLNLKVQHLKEVNKYFNNNPIVVNVDDDQLVDLNKHLHTKVQHLKEVNKYFNSNPITVNTDVTKLDELEERLGKLSSKTITITVESDLSKQLEKSLTDAVQSAVRDAVSEQSASSQQQAQKEGAQSNRPQKVDVVASPMRSIVDGLFEGVGKKLTKGLDRSIEDAVGVNMDTMTRISSNMLLRYFGVGKKAQSDPKNEQKRVEAIVKDGMTAFIKTHDNRATSIVDSGNAATTRSRKTRRVQPLDDDIGVDFQSLNENASRGVLRYFGVGKKAQSDPKDQRAKIEAIVKDIVADYSGSTRQSNAPNVITQTLTGIGNSFLNGVDQTVENIAQRAKVATVKAVRQSSQNVLANAPDNVQSTANVLFDNLEGKTPGKFTEVAGKQLFSVAKKSASDLFKTILPNTSTVVKDFLNTGTTPAKTAAPVVKSSSDVLKEAAADLKNAAKALSDASIGMRSESQAVSKTKAAKPPVAETTPDNSTPLPKQLPVKENKVPLPPPAKKRELEPIPVNIPEQIKPLFQTIQSEIVKNIDISQGYKDATAAENKLIPLPPVSSTKTSTTKKYAQTSLEEIDKALTSIKSYFADEYKRIKARVQQATAVGTHEEIKSARAEVATFISRSNEAVATVDRFVKTGEDAGFSKDINSELSAIHSKGKAPIARNVSSAKKLEGKLNLADKELFNQQLKSYTALAQQHGVEIPNGLQNGIKQGAGGVSDAARIMLDDLIKTVKTKMQIQSPSWLMFELGLMITSGLFLGMQKGNSKVAQGARQIVATVTDIVGAVKTVADPALGTAMMIPGLTSISTYGSAGLSATDTGLKILGKVGERHAANPSETLFQSVGGSAKDFVDSIVADKTLTKPREAFDHTINIAKAGALGLGANPVAVNAVGAAQAGMTALLRNSAITKAITQAHGQTKAKLQADTSLDYMSTFKSVLNDNLKDLKLSKSEIVRAISSVMKVVPTGLGTGANSNFATAGYGVDAVVDTLSVPLDLYRKSKSKVGQGLPVKDAIAASVADYGAPQGIANVVGSLGAKLHPSLNNFIKIGKQTNEGLSQGILSTVALSANAINTTGDAIQNKIKQNMGISSPSKVMIALGVMIASGLAIGIKQGVVDVSGASQSLTNVVYDIQYKVDEALALVYISLPEKLRNIIDSLSSGYGAVVSKVVQTTTNAINSGIEKYKPIKQLFNQSLGQDPSNVAVGLFQALQKDLGKNSVIPEKLNNLKKAITEKINSIRQLFLSTPIGQSVEKFFGSLSGKLNNFDQSVTTKLKSFFEGGGNTFDISKYLTGFTNLKGLTSIINIKDIGINLITSFGQGFLSASTGVFGIVTRFTTGILSIIKRIFGIASPSKVMQSIGLDFGEGFENGAVASLVLANKRIADLISKTVNESTTATEAQKAKAASLSSLIDTQNQKIARGFKEGTYNDSNTSDVFKELALGTKTVKKVAKSSGVAESEIPSILQQSRREVNSLPKAYTDILKAVAQITGVSINSKNAPKLVPTTFERESIAGSYSASKNTIKVSEAFFQELTNKKLSEVSDDLVSTVVHELFHGVQQGFGTISKDIASTIQADASLAEIAKMSPNIEHSVASVRKQTQDPSLVAISRGLETGAYVFENRYASIIKNQPLQQLPKLSNLYTSNSPEKIRQAILDFGKSYRDLWQDGSAMAKTLEKMGIDSTESKTIIKSITKYKDELVDLAAKLDKAGNLSPEEIDQAVDEIKHIESKLGLVRTAFKSKVATSLDEFSAPNTIAPVTNSINPLIQSEPQISESTEQTSTQQDTVAQPKSNSFFDTIKHAVLKGNNLKEIGINLITAFGQGFLSANGGVLGLVTKFATGVLTTIKKIFRIASPSGEGIDVGENIASSTGTGIDNNAHVAVDAARRMAESVNNVLHETLILTPGQSKGTTGSLILPNTTNLRTRELILPANYQRPQSQRIGLDTLPLDRLFRPVIQKLTQPEARLATVPVLRSSVPINSLAPQIEFNVPNNLDQVVQQQIKTLAASVVSLQQNKSRLPIDYTGPLILPTSVKPELQNLSILPAKQSNPYSGEIITSHAAARVRQPELILPQNYLRSQSQAIGLNTLPIDRLFRPLIQKLTRLNEQLPSTAVLRSNLPTTNSNIFTRPVFPNNIQEALATPPRTRIYNGQLILPNSARPDLQNLNILPAIQSNPYTGSILTPNPLSRYRPIITAPNQPIANPDANLILPNQPSSTVQRLILPRSVTRPSIRINLDALTSGNMSQLFNRFPQIPDPWTTAPRPVPLIPPIPRRPVPPVPPVSQSRSRRPTVNLSSPLPNQPAPNYVACFACGAANVPNYVNCVACGTPNPAVSQPSSTTPLVSPLNTSTRSQSPRSSRKKGMFVGMTDLFQNVHRAISPVLPARFQANDAEFYRQLHSSNTGATIQQEALSNVRREISSVLPSNVTSHYLGLGKDLITNLFTAVSDSVRQSTLSGYASLGQVMRNAVNAALFSLADTLKQPLYQGLLSQSRSIMPWFMKFIPKTLQLVPMLKPLIPVLGGLTLGLGNAIIKNLLNNDVLKPGGFLTKLLSSITRIDLSSLSGQKAHGILGGISRMLNPIPSMLPLPPVAGVGIGGSMLGMFGMFMNMYGGILGLDQSSRSNPRNQAPTVERVLQEQTAANRKKAGLGNAKGTQASQQLIENLGNTAIDSVLENLNIPMIPTSVIQGFTGNKLKQQSGSIAGVLNSLGLERSRAEQLLEKTVKSGRTNVGRRTDILTKQVLRERGVTQQQRDSMTPKELEAARKNILKAPLDITKRERELLRFLGDMDTHEANMGVDAARRKRDKLIIPILTERGMSRKQISIMRQSNNGQYFDDVSNNLRSNLRTGSFVGKLTEAYAGNDQEAMKGLLLEGLKKAGMSSQQLKNIDPKLLDTATAGLMTSLTGLQAKFKEKGFDMGKSIAQGFKDSVRNLANAKDDLEYNAKKALGQANFGDALGVIFKRMSRGTVATQDQFKEMYNQMGSGVKKALFSNSKEADETFPNVLQFMGSIAATLAPVTSLFASLSPLFLPLAPIIGGIGAAVSMVAPHVAKLMDGIQRVEVLQRRFTFLGGSKAGGEAEFKYAKDIANKMNVPSEVAANSYSQLAIAAKDSKMEGQGVRDLFEGITASLSALGINGHDASLVFMAYTQILAKGKLSMEELRQQLGEKFPPAMGVFAKAMGMSVPEMTALISSGGVLSHDILPKVAKVLNQDYGNSAASQAGGLVVALNKLGNVGFEITTIFTDKLGGTLGFFVSTFADGLSLFSKSLGALIPLGQSFAIGFAATIGIGLTVIMTKFKPLVTLLGSLQHLLMATFSVVATNMMPMIIGVTADVADNWLGAEKDMIANMKDGITNIVVATFSTIDSVMRSMSDGNVSFSSMFGSLVQGAEQAGNMIDWLKGVFSGFFKVIPPGFIELLAMVFMFEQGAGLMTMALAPAFKGLFGALTGMLGGAAKAFVGVMTSMKVASELMMTSMSAAITASEARIKIFSATLGFLRTALTHIGVAFAILMFSKGDFSNPMGESLKEATKELNNGLTEIRANVQKTADSFDKATNNVKKLGGSLADTLPSKGVQLDIRSFWGGGDFKWDDAIKARNKGEASPVMDFLGVSALGFGAGGAAFAGTKMLSAALVPIAANAAATALAAAQAGSLSMTAASIPFMGKVAMALVPILANPFGAIAAAAVGLLAALIALSAAFDVFAPKLTKKQKEFLDKPGNEGVKSYFDTEDPNARLTNAQQQVLQYFEDQEKNIQNLKEFAASQGFTGKPSDFVADIKPLTIDQQQRFNSDKEISNLNRQIEDNNNRRLAVLADAKARNASPQEIKDIQNSTDFKNLENQSKEMRNAVALAAADFQIGDSPENRKNLEDIDKQIAKKQAELKQIERKSIENARARSFSAGLVGDFAPTYLAPSTVIGDPDKLQKEIQDLEAQKNNKSNAIKASIQRAFDFKEIKNVDKQLEAATKRSVELNKALPSDKVRKEQGDVKQLIQQLYKKREDLVNSFGSPLPILERLLKQEEEYKQKLISGAVEGVKGQMIPAAVQKTQARIDQLKTMIAGAKPFDVRPMEEALYTQATNAVKDANIRFERATSANRVESNLSQAKIYASSGTSQQIAPELARRQLEDLGSQRSLLTEKINSDQVALDKISQVIAAGGTNLNEAQAEFDKLQADIIKDKESLSQNTLETIKAQRDMRQALIDQTKQVAEYYRTSVREAQAAGIEFEKASNTLKNQQNASKLKQAILGTGNNIFSNFVDGLIGILQQVTDIQNTELDKTKQKIDYQNNLDDINLRVSELQRSLPGKIIPFDANKIKDFDDQLKTVQGSVVGINSNVQSVVQSLGQDAVIATNTLNDAFLGLGDTITGVGTRLDATIDKLNQANTTTGSAFDGLTVQTNQSSTDWASNALNVLNQLDNATPSVLAAIPSVAVPTPPRATTPSPTVTPTVATQFASPIKNTTIQDLINYKPTFGQSVMGNRPKGRIHNKVDFDSQVKGGAGAEIISSLAGVAKLQKWGGQDAAVFVNSILPSGTQITIEYGHLALNSIKNTLGDLSKPVQVQAGQKLGNVLGHHLDFGVRANGRYINPQVFLANLAKGDYGAIASQPPATAKTKANTVTPASQSKGESVIRMQRLGQKDEFGLEKIQLAVIKQGKLIDSFVVNSGSPQTQIFGGAGETKAGSKQPVEFGSYKLGKTTPSGNKAKMGNEFIRLEPDFKTERTAIGFHIDKDRLVDPGSSGCIVFANEAEFNKFKQALKSTGIKSFVFDQAVGAVEIAKNVASQVKPLPQKQAVMSGNLRITQGGNDLSPEEYAKLTPLGKELYELRRNKYILALGSAVARAEGSDFRKNTENFGYGLTIGGENVTDFSKHPYVGTGRKPTWIKWINNSSTAAGRYQMMNFNASIQAAKKQFGKNAMPDMFKLTDYQGQDQPSFSPGMQDLYFIYSLKSRGVLDQVLAGQVDPPVLNKLATHYASIQSGKNRSAYQGQGTPQGRHSNFLKAYQENLKILDSAQISGSAVDSNKLQEAVVGAGTLSTVTAKTRDETQRLNTEAQQLQKKQNVQSSVTKLFLEADKGLRSTQTSIIESGLNTQGFILDNRFGVSPAQRIPLELGRFNLDMTKRINELQDIISETGGVTLESLKIKFAPIFEEAAKLGIEIDPQKVEEYYQKTFKMNQLRHEQAKKQLKELTSVRDSLTQDKETFLNNQEEVRKTGIGLQTEKLQVGLLQKQIEQRKLLQQLNPLDPRSARTADLEANLALKNADVDYREKLNSILSEEGKSLSVEEAQKRRNLAKEELELNKQNIELKRRSDNITEDSAMPSKLLERAQFIQDSFKGVQESRSSLLKAYGLDFRAEKIDRELAITNLQMDFAKANLQLDDFIRKNAEATGANKLTNEQIETLRKNLKLTNETKLDAIKLQFSELGTVVKGVTGGFRSGFKEFLLSTKGFGESIGDLFNSIFKGLLDPLADIASKRVTDALFGWTEGLFGNKKQPTDGINAVKGLTDLSMGANGLNLAGMTLNQAGQMLMNAALTLSSQTVANTAMDAGGNIFGDLLGGVFDVLSGSVFNANSMGFNPTPGLFDAIPTDFGVATLPIFAEGGIVGALNKERSLTGRTPHLIVASEGERVLNHRETAIWNKLQSGVAGFANGGVVGAGGNGSIASRIGNTTTINVPVNVEVGGNSEVDTYRLSQAVQAMVSDGIRREMRVGGSINRGNPYGR